MAGPTENSTTNRDGYREYKSDPKVCANCPSREKCTKSKSCVKTVTRHIWKDYEELAEDARYTPFYARMYKLRKETIERVFADAKEKHAMRYTTLRGLTQVRNWVKLKFAAMNLKKLAKRKWKERYPSYLICFELLISNYLRKNPSFAQAKLGFLDSLGRAAYCSAPDLFMWMLAPGRWGRCSRIASAGWACGSAGG